MKDDVILITGVTKGIGRETCEDFCRNDYTVYGIARNKEIAESMMDKYDNLKIFLGDITDDDFIFSCIKSIRSDGFKLKYLINNIGIEINEPIGMIKNESIEKMFTTNVFSLIKLLQLSTRIMVNGGGIVNVASNVALKGNPGQLVYGATKGAVIAITKTAAKELAPRRIRVNTVVPGLTNTEMIKNTDEKFIENRKGNILLGRLVEPSDISNVMLFLCSDKSNMISGQEIIVDGNTIM